MEALERKRSDLNFRRICTLTKMHCFFSVASLQAQGATSSRWKAAQRQEAESYDCGWMSKWWNALPNVHCCLIIWWRLLFDQKLKPTYLRLDRHKCNESNMSNTVGSNHIPLGEGDDAICSNVFRSGCPAQWWSTQWANRQAALLPLGTAPPVVCGHSALLQYTPVVQYYTLTKWRLLVLHCNQDHTPTKCRGPKADNRRLTGCDFRLHVLS